ncbi:hypothetical protein ACLMJK_006233 [Lecanora helva]
MAESQLTTPAIQMPRSVHVVHQAGFAERIYTAGRTQGLSNTQCLDGTICPNANNDACCDAGKGITEIKFNDADLLPSGTADLLTYYAHAGYTTLPSSSAAASKTVVVTSNGAVATIAETKTLPQPVSSGSGLSTGAKAGIGVGVPIGVALIGCALYFLIKRKSKRRQQTSMQKVPLMPITTQEKPRWKSELPDESALAKVIHELPADEAPPAEMAAPKKIHELRSE